ncbi:MAG: hypothetical protein QOF69_2431 [Solirubrobacteraceae bacterium]|nr:hypothetical protein [Solirubrobacteraceae bacterium]
MAHVPAIAVAELYARGLAGFEPRLLARDEDGRARPLQLQRWLGSPTAADQDVLARAVAPVLDVGCGPGRHVLALMRAGCKAVGVDIAAAAVRVARGRGAEAIQGSIFADVPGAGSWGSALLLDGNIGIGGHPAVLLARVASLLRPAGRLLVEFEPPEADTVTQLLRLEGAAQVSSWFRWSTVSVAAVGELAEASGLTVSETWEIEGRWFAELERGPAATAP